MKSVSIDRDISIRIKRKVFVKYKAGVTYHRVPEMQVRKIIAADAGKIVAGSHERSQL